MKRNIVNPTVKFISFIALIFAVVASFMSCNGANEKSVLWYQEEIVAVRCTLETSGGNYDRYVFDLKFGETDQVIIIEPEVFSGVTFIRDGESAKFGIGTSYVELKDGVSGDIDIVLNAFKIKEDDISSIGKNDNGDTYFGALVDGGVYTVVLDETGIPSKISFDGTTSLKITDITVYKDGEYEETFSTESLMQDETSDNTGDILS